MLADASLGRAAQQLRGKRRFRFALSRRLSASVRKHGILATLAAVLLAGCSMHPMSDDVSPTKSSTRAAREAGPPVIVRPVGVGSF